MKLPYKFQYNGELPDTVLYNGQVVDIFKIGDKYIPANEATYLKFTSLLENGNTTEIKIDIKNEDDHKSMILVGTDDSPPQPYSSGYISPGGSIAYRLPINKNNTKYIIIPFKHSIHRAVGVQYDRYTAKETFVNSYWTCISGYIGGKCISVDGGGTGAFESMCIGTEEEDLEFSPKFTGAIGSRALFSRILQPELNLGGTSTIGAYAINLSISPYSSTLNELSVTLTTSPNLTSAVDMYLNVSQATGKTYNLVCNLPSTKTDVIVGDYPRIGFSNVNSDYPNAITTSVTYNFAENLDEETAKLCYPALFDEQLGGFAYRMDYYKVTPADINKLATTNYILPATDIRFNAEACTITPPEHNNVSAEFCSVLGNSEEKTIPNAFILGKSRLGSGAVYISHLDYFNSRYMSNEYGNFNTPFNIHLETKTKTKTLTLMFDEQNDYHPAYITYSYVTLAGETKIATNTDNTSRVTLTFEEPTKIIDIIISTWNIEHEPLIITGIYAGEPYNE